MYLCEIYVTFSESRNGVKLASRTIEKNGELCVTKKPNKSPSLEESLSEISTLIEKMEHGELSLEQSLNHFERGVTLIKHCQKILEEAEQKVKVLIQNNNQEELSSYGEGNQDGDSKNNEHHN